MTMLFLCHQEMAPKQKQDHIIKWENNDTMVSKGSHMLDSRVKSDLVTLKNDETHSGGGIRNQEILGLDKVSAVTESLIMTFGHRW